MLDRHLVEPVFIGTWIVLIVGTLIYNALETNYRRKALMARIMPPVVAALFLGFVALLGGPVWFALPFVAVITLLNMFTIKICLACGKMNRSPMIFPLPKYCHNCGEPLNGEPPAN